MATASGSVKPVTLELGGKSPMPMIVFEDADWCYDGQLSVSRPGTWVLLIFSLRCFFFRFAPMVLAYLFTGKSKSKMRL